MIGAGFAAYCLLPIAYWFPTSDPRPLIFESPSRHESGRSPSRWARLELLRVIHSCAILLRSQVVTSIYFRYAEGRFIVVQAAAGNSLVKSQSTRRYCCHLVFDPT